MSLIKNEALCTKNEDFDQTYLNTGSKIQNVKAICIWYSIIISGKISKVLVNKTPS